MTGNLTCVSMSTAEFVTLRASLGLSHRYLCTRFDVSERTVGRWESGAYAVPDQVAAELREMLAHMRGLVDGYVELLAGEPDPVIYTYADEHDYRRREPDGEWSAQWHRALIAKVLDRVPNLRVEFFPQD